MIVFNFYCFWLIKNSYFFIRVFKYVKRYTIIMKSYIIKNKVSNRNRGVING